MFDQIPKLRSMATKEAVALTSTIMKSLDVKIESATGTILGKIA